MAEETKDSSIKLNEEKSLKKSKNNVKKQEQKAENDKIDDRRDSISMRTYKTSISTVESQVLTRQELPDGEESLKNSLIIVNKMVTEYIQIGFEKLIEEKFTPLYPNKKEGVVFVIPGFLGSITYYKPFMIHLYNELKLPIVGISHGDHCRPTLDIKQANVKSKGVPIIIVAHSIGAAIALQMLRMNSNLTVSLSRGKNKKTRCCRQYIFVEFERIIKMHKL
ncbi:hypothetical protein B4U79_18095 [Dinothrombium tinctorium]|uniref:Lipid droplet-associated hydrolase n=1 Tax=Dinothrombium tinctorium TaxID=1965070 RepID=A0A3S3QK69_9ACAR|nr:hypothetical protein B4U79_18095 [Dinothrombium tinctorium]